MPRERRSMYHTLAQVRPPRKPFPAGNMPPLPAVPDVSTRPTTTIAFDREQDPALAYMQAMKNPVQPPPPTARRGVGQQPSILTMSRYSRSTRRFTRPNFIKRPAPAIEPLPVIPDGSWRPQPGILDLSQLAPDPKPSATTMAAGQVARLGQILESWKRRIIGGGDEGGSPSSGVDASGGPPRPMISYPLQRPPSPLSSQASIGGNHSPSVRPSAPTSTPKQMTTAVRHDMLQTEPDQALAHIRIPSLPPRISRVWRPGVPRVPVTSMMFTSEFPMTPSVDDEFGSFEQRSTMAPTAH